MLPPVLLLVLLPVLLLVLLPVLLLVLLPVLLLVLELRQYMLNWPVLQLQKVLQLLLLLLLLPTGALDAAPNISSGKRRGSGNLSSLLTLSMLVAG